MLKPLRNVSHTLWKVACLENVGEKIILLVCVHHPHAGECAKALYVNTCKMYVNHVYSGHALSSTSTKLS